MFHRMVEAGTWSGDQFGNVIIYDPCKAQVNGFWSEASM